VHVVISTQTVSRLLGTFWQITGSAAIVSIVITIFMLNFFLRKTISNERLLRRAEDQNLQLSEQLHEAQRQLMNVEKLAVMGQLTANFAHEIGTPLNAISGHLQLLGEEVADKSRNRLSILNGEVSRIEQIVKGFLQTTAKPVSQRQLVDINTLIDKTMGLVRPRLDAMELEVRCDLDRTMGPLRVVPLDIEQILLNLVNNSLDSLSSKRQGDERRALRLDISTKVARKDGEDWAEVSVHDTGMGIPKSDLRNVLKPFFTTKRPGEGTGLGLTICQQLASKYGGVLNIDAKEGAWAEVKLTLPYRNTLDA
jgi:signal transduction histidine kinase